MFSLGRPRFFGSLQRMMWRFLLGPGSTFLHLGQKEGMYFLDFFLATMRYLETPGIRGFHRGFSWGTR